VDSDSYAYVTGHTESTDFPFTVGAYQVALAGGYDAFVTKLSQDGSALVYSTYLGGTDDDDKAYSIAVDSNHHAYVTGLTRSNDFPTQNPFQPALVGAADAFVTKLSPDGSALVYSTYLGGEDIDWGYAIALDTNNCAYVTGDTRSPLLFPTQNPYQATLAGGTSDAFVTKMAQDGASLVYSTYLGGNASELGEGIAVDSNNYAYVDGYTDSIDFPTQNPYQGALAGEVDAFVTKMAQDGASLVYSTYLGGDFEDYAHDIALDSEGHAYATGKTEAPGDFPTTAGAFQTSFGGGNYDVFVTKLSLAGNSLMYSTYFGGDGFDLAEGIVVDPDNHAYFAGETWSSTGTLPVTSDAFQPAYAGNGDAFATKLSPAGDALVYSSYLGGTGWDIGTGIALDPDDHAYVSGWTQSGDFPTTDGAFMEYPGGVSYPDVWDAFAAKIVAPCDLTTDSTAGGLVTDPGEGTFTYEKGTVVDLVATPDADYDFDNWTGDVGTIDDVDAATTTITMEDDYDITANFEEVSPQPPPSTQYTLAINSTDGGSVTTPGEGASTYDVGTVVALAATPDTGYQFVNWTGDVDTIADVDAAATNITMDDNYEITANFEEVSPQPPPSTQYTLAINSTDGGSVTTPGEGASTHDAGMVVALVATPDTGHQFVNWTGDVDTITDADAAATNITMNGNYSVTAHFEEIPPPINWTLIVGIIVAVIVVGLVIFFLIRRRRKSAQTKGS
jgi:preprotein translocase subunit YajC